MNGPYAFVYLLGSLLFLPIWLLLFWRLPGARREMLVMSGLFVSIGVPIEALLYTRDWWHPVTITGTLVGIEDVIYSIGNGGYMAALYMALTRPTYQRSAPPSLWLRGAPVLCLVLVPLVLVFGFGVHSFVATTVGSLAALAIVLGARPDLTRVAVVTGVVGAAVAIPVYLAMEAIFPGSIAATWDLPHLSGLLPLGIPIEDLLWYVYTCAVWGTYYKFATGLRVASQAARKIDGSGRDAEIRTRGLVVPNDARYQAALHPENCALGGCRMSVLKRSWGLPLSLWLLARPIPGRRGGDR